ncbi:unnamed protein product [Symbiodinium sp. KB8]|nr:unnamed protein product [Symbiodinium sp. KB8]
MGGCLGGPKDGSSEGQKVSSVTICGLDGKTLGKYKIDGDNVADLCAKLSKDVTVPDDCFLELAYKEKKLEPKLSLEGQGVRNGATLTLLKSQGRPVVGCHEFNLREYPEDRYSTWQEIEFKEDHTCTYAKVSAGPGRCSNVSTTDKKVEKHGTWTMSDRNHTRAAVVIQWDDGQGETKFIFH